MIPSSSAQAEIPPLCVGGVPTEIENVATSARSEKAEPMRFALFSPKTPTHM